MFTTRRTWRSALAVLGAAAVIASAPAPALAASSAPWIAYGGTSVNNARVPAGPVELTTRSPRAFDTLTYVVDGRVVSAPATATQLPDGDWSATARADLSGFAGRVSVTARLTSGRSSSSIAKSVRVVDPASTLGNGSAGTITRPSRVARAQFGDGRPGALTTGLRGGSPRTVLTGDQTITRKGTVLDGVQIEGCLVVKADDVVIRNSRIVCHRPGRQLAVNVADGTKNLVVEDSEIDAAGADVGIGWGNYTLRRVNLHGSADGARWGTKVTIEDSWIHDMSREDGLHSDAMQTTSGSAVVIRHNPLDPSNSGDPLNSAIMIGTETGQRALKNVLIEGNFLGGGAYTVNIRSDATISGLVIKGNVFEDNSRYGAVVAPTGRDIVFAGNVMGWTGKGIAIDPR